MLATDPDADRVGIAMKCPDGSYELVSGNEMGALLLHIFRDVAFKFAEAYITLGFLEFLQEIVGEEAMPLG